MEKKVEISPTLFYNIVNSALAERKITPENMSLRSIKELYTNGTITLDFADGDSW